MVEDANNLHLAQESGDDVPRCDAAWKDKLQGHDSVHEAMPGLEDPAHRPDSDPIEQDVSPEYEPVRPSAEEVLRLKFRQPTFLDELLCERTGVEGISDPDQAFPDRSEIRLGEDP